MVIKISTTRLDVGQEQLQNAELKNYSETTVTANSGSSCTLDFLQANVYNITLTANCTFAFANPPASGKAALILLFLTQDANGGWTVTWPANVKWPGGVAPTATSTAGLGDIWRFITVNGGTTWLGYQETSNFAINPQPLYVEDVFSAYTYTGNGSTQSIVNGIDLAGKGGMVWQKDRGTAYRHMLSDTIQGPGKFLFSNQTDATNSWGPAGYSFNSNGFSVGYPTYINNTGSSIASWTFRKSAKFFDIQTWTGNGTTQTINHNLGIQPGMVIIKDIGATGSWGTWHRGNGITDIGGLSFDSTAAAYWPNQGSLSYFTATTFNPWRVYDYAGNFMNTAGHTYIAYLFAHDTSASGIIQCGSYTPDGTTPVTLGWEPQFLLIKNTGSVENWQLMDTARGWYSPIINYGQPALFPNTSGAETIYNSWKPTSTGFLNTDMVGAHYIYCAIRRGPMRTPTLGTQVFNAIAYTGNSAAKIISGVGFSPDLLIDKIRAGNTIGAYWMDRLRGAKQALQSNTTTAETALTAGAADLVSFDMDGVTYNVPSASQMNTNTFTDIDYFLKRAPGFFDEVCATTSGASGSLIAHNLGVSPELVIYKTRGSADAWYVCVAANGFGQLQATAAWGGLGNGSGLGVNLAHVSATTFNDGGFFEGNGITVVAYLFATLSGVSKVGSYTGNGTNQNLSMGFSGNARFFLCKRTDSTGDWFVWDSVRGINGSGANDPHLSLNTTAAEVTTDSSVEPFTGGINVVQNATTNINVNTATYIYLAIA